MFIETHPDGYLTAGTERGEVMIWDKVHLLNNKHRYPYIVWREH
jgi:hypothetical protein